MGKDNDPIRERFIHQVGELAGGLGLNRSVGQLYALLYMNPEPVSLDEMAEACRMSKGNASLNVRELERWGAVRRVWVPGDRKDYYEANRNLSEIVISRLQDGFGRRLRALQDALLEAGEGIEQMSNDEPSKAFYRKRLDEIRRLHRSVERVLANLDRLYSVAKRFT